jgi:hypothetical protein
MWNLISAPDVLSINITIFGPSNKANHELVCALLKYGLPGVPTQGGAVELAKGVGLR